MQARIKNSSTKEVTVGIKDSDIGMLYLIQHELLKEKSVDFAGLILKHPHTNECTMRVNSSKGNPLKEIQNATNSAIESVNDLKKLIKSKIKVK
ncbi:MAG: RNA_pol_L_2 domain-containing protein [Nitrosopumilales archaeon]|nr:MAG: RNA_pol_L_2 domain-containing protein [Nitrosopumilales archaeon]